MCTTGKTAECIQGNILLGKPSYMTEEARFSVSLTVAHLTYIAGLRYNAQKHPRQRRYSLLLELVYLATFQPRDR